MFLIKATSLFALWQSLCTLFLRITLSFQSSSFIKSLLECTSKETNLAAFVALLQFIQTSDIQCVRATNQKLYRNWGAKACQEEYILKIWSIEENKTEI